MSQKVSVIVTCYNHEQYIETCLRSIFHQTFTEISLLVINDGSTDASGEIIQEVLRETPFSPTVYLTQENQGIVPSRNQGLEWAFQQNTEFILFVDSDNYLEVNFLEEMLKTAQENDADIVYPTLFDPEKKEVYVHAQLGDMKQRIRGNNIDNCSLLRASMVQNQRYDIKLNRLMLEDYDFILRLIANGAKAIPVPFEKTFLNYRVIQGARSDRSQEDYFRAYYFLVIKHSTQFPEYVQEALMDIWLDQQSQKSEVESEAAKLEVEKKRLCTELEEVKKQLVEKEEHVKHLEDLHQDIIRSKAYRLGLALVNPWRKWKRLFGRK